MRAFAELLDRLSLTASRNAKLTLVRDYLHATPDPDRGWALAALTGELTFDAAKPAAIRKAVAGAGASFVTRDQLVSAKSAYSAHLIEVRQRSTALIIVLFCFIAILNTLLMATAQRRRDVAVLRAVGATPRQVLWFFVAESAVVMAIALVLAGAATAVNLSALRIALRQLFGSAPMSVPWLVIAGIAAVSGLLALAGTVLPVVTALRARTISLVNTGG